MANRTATIDSQVHAYERNRPERPWSGFLQGPDEVTGDDMVTAMEEVGVDGALLVSPFSMYRYDASYALEVGSTHPGRFGLIKPFDPHSELVDEEIVQWAETPGVVGARIMLTAQPFEADDQGINRILSAGAQAGIPINVMCSGKLCWVNWPTATQIHRLWSIMWVWYSPPSHRRRQNRSPIWPTWFHLQHSTTWPSRFPAHVPCRMSHSLTRIFGSLWAGYSKRSASTDACGAPTGHGRLDCCPTSKV